MDRAERAPQQAFHLRIEREPVGRIPPAFRHAVRRALPGPAAIIAMKTANVGVIDEDMLWIERVKLHTVAGSNIQPSRAPAVVSHAHRIDLGPRLPAIQRAPYKQSVAR